MSHLTEQDRCKLENYLNAGLQPTGIAEKLNRNHSTIVREIRKHRVPEESRRNYCIGKSQCYRRGVCKYPPEKCPGRCSSCRIIPCNRHCPDFVEDRCERLEHSPYVCNGCKNVKDCRKRHYFYLAGSSHKSYKRLLSDCRTGINASASELQEYDSLLKSGGRKGQAIHHIMASNPDVFQKCEKTLYNYYNKNYFSLPRGEMPRMCMRKTRTTGTIRHKVDFRCREGRTLEDFHKFQLEHRDFAVVEMDSVIGRTGGKVLLTLQFECGMMLAHLRDTNNSRSVLDYFDWIEAKAGLETFRKMFPVLLTDNGSEFSNPNAIEHSRICQERRTNVFYCDAYFSWQKGHIENNHTNLRRILPKGIALDHLTQQDVNLVLSHLNSYMRRGYDDVPAVERFRALFGDDVLNLLGIQRIVPDDIVLDPKLLKGKIMF